MAWMMMMLIFPFHLKAAQEDYFLHLMAEGHLSLLAKGMWKK